MRDAMRRFGLAAAVLVLTTARADAALILFAAHLTGAQEVPPNASPGTGLGTVLLNDVTNVITVDESFANLTAAATLSHIHGPAAPGVSAPVLFPFTGVPAVTSGSIPEQVFTLTPTQVVQLEAGQFYFNVHDANFPAGEIRGQILPAAAPEPATVVGAITAGLFGLGYWLRRARAA